MSVKKNLDVIIVEKLKDNIVRGLWRPGQKLQIDEIAQEYGVSRTPIMQAIKVMAVEGMLMPTSSGKVMVPEFTQRQIQDICRVRLLLEDHAVEQIGENPALCTDALTQLADDCACALIQGDIVKSRKKDLAFHKQLVRTCGNTCLENLYVKVQGQFAVCNYLIAIHNRDAQTDAVDEHFQFLRMLRDGNTADARELLEMHIKRAADKIVSSMRDVAAVN